MKTFNTICVFPKMALLKIGVYVHLVFMIIFLSCENFIDIDVPSTNVNTENVYLSDNTATSVITGIYARLSNSTLADGFISLSLLPELSADNMALLDLSNNEYLNFFTNNLQPDITFDTSYWRSLYQLIYICNAAIEGLSSSSKLTGTVKDQLLGEAYFLRALFIFYCTGIYGDIPLPLTTDYIANSNLNKRSEEQTSELQSLMRISYAVFCWKKKKTH